MCRFVQCADAELQSDHHSRECQAGSAQAAVATAHPEPPDVMKLFAGGGGVPGVHVRWDVRSGQRVLQLR